MAYFFEEEPDDWAEEQQTAQQQHPEDSPPEEYQPEPWEIAGVDADNAEHSGRLPAEYDPSAPNMRGGCRNCDSFTVDLRWREAFGVYLCAHRAPSMQRGPHATALVSIAYCTGMKMPNSRPRPLWLWPAGAIRASEMWTSYRR